jgi:hypothetical protein
MFLIKTPSRQDVTRGEIMALLNHHSDSDVIRVRWTGNEGTAIVTTGELRLALADDAIDPAEIESLQFLPRQ